MSKPKRWEVTEWIPNKDTTTFTNTLEEAKEVAAQTHNKVAIRDTARLFNLDSTFYTVTQFTTWDRCPTCKTGRIDIHHSWNVGERDVVNSIKTIVNPHYGEPRNIDGITVVVLNDHFEQHDCFRTKKEAETEAKRRNNRRR